LKTGRTHVDPRNYALAEDQDRKNLFAATKGDKSAMRLFVKLLWTHSITQISG